MFATLLGTLPRPPLPDGAAAEAVLDAVLELQLSNGLEPLIDGGWPVSGDDPVAAWTATARRAEGIVKAVVDGPVSSGRSASEVRAILLRLADAGCPWIEVHEPAAATIGADPDAGMRFAETHRALTEGFDGIHLSLAVTGGAADDAGIETILAGSYASLALDVIDGPGNWRLAAVTPTECGLVCGALSTRAGSDDGPEILLWAVSYAASTGGRGPDRVGLATAGSLGHLPWESAARKVERLGHAARLAVAPTDVRKAAIDPRAVDIRSAATGRYVPPASSRRSRKSRKSSSPGE